MIPVKSRIQTGEILGGVGLVVDARRIEMQFRDEAPQSFAQQRRALHGVKGADDGRIGRRPKRRLEQEVEVLRRATAYFAKDAAPK